MRGEKDAERGRGILADAGFQEVVVEAQDMPAGGNDLDGALDLALRVGPLGAQLRERPEARAAAVADVRAALATHLEDGRVYLPSATWIISARTA